MLLAEMVIEFGPSPLVILSIVLAGSVAVFAGLLLFLWFKRRNSRTPNGSTHS